MLSKKYGKILQERWVYRIVLIAMNKKQTIIALMMGITGLIGPAFAPATASALEKCGNVDTSIIACDETNGDDKIENNAIWALLMIVINVMTAGIGILAVAGIVYGAVLYSTAEDKADQVKKATNIITNVVIGLVLYALMWAGLNFVIPGGVFA